MRGMQTPEGSFRALEMPSESDMRFLYCACAISHVLDDWTAIDIDRAVRAASGHGHEPHREDFRLILPSPPADKLRSEKSRLRRRLRIASMAGVTW
eukprot:scaffold1102_cov256-Pinguiococcus_pyrenoidosus.AAC.47